jgi:hypothetical protein
MYLHEFMESMFVEEIRLRPLREREHFLFAERRTRPRSATRVAYVSLLFALMFL